MLRDREDDVGVSVELKVKAVVPGHTALLEVALLVVLLGLQGKVNPTDSSLPVSSRSMILSQGRSILCI